MHVITLLFTWYKKNITLLINASSLIGATAITSLMGFVYWWLAARQYPLEAVGVASAAVSAMMLLGGFCVLGLGTLLITEIPRQPEKAASFISTGLLVVGITGVIAGMGFTEIAPLFSASFQPLQASILIQIEFGLGVSFTAMTLVMDQALIGLLRGELQLWRNIFFSIAKMSFLLFVGLALAQKTGMSIYTTWTIGNALSLLFLLCWVRNKRPHFLRSCLPRWEFVRKMGLPALQHHMLNMTLQAPGMILPVLVTALLSAKMNAWFYVAWMIAGFVFVIPGALTTVLHAMNSAHTEALGQKIRVTIGLAVLSAILVNLYVQVAPQQLLSTFGHSYAEQASWCLRILVFGAFPQIIKNHYISICRIHDRIGRAMISMAPGGLLEICAAAAGAKLGGLNGLSLGWIGALCIEALFMLPAIYRVTRKAHTFSSAPATSTMPIAAEHAIVLNSGMLPLVEPDYNGLSEIWKLKTMTMLAIKQPQQEMGTHNHQTGFKRPPRLQPYNAYAQSPATPALQRSVPSGLRTQLQHLLASISSTDSITTVLPLGGFLLWLTSLSSINMTRMNNYGLISVLPPAAIIALVLLSISFCLTLRLSKERTGIIVLHIVLLICMLYGITALVEDVPRFTTVYKHAGYVEYILRNRSVDPALDIYFDWTGFFILGAYMTQAAGYHSVLEYAAWTPLVLNLLYLGPLYSIYTTAVAHKRQLWLALWIFYVCNWIGQDYYSPQGLNFFFYLVIIAILLKWFRVPFLSHPPIWLRFLQWSGRLLPAAKTLHAWIIDRDSIYTPAQGWQRGALLVLLLVLFGFMVSSHPLTPFFVLAAASVLAYLRRGTPWWLPIVMAVMVVEWIVTMGQPFIAGHSSMVVGNVGHISNAVSTNVTARTSQGDAAHTFVTRTRVIMTAILWLLALLGVIYRLTKGYRDSAFLLLALAPFPLIGMQNYGGEMFLRIYLFALPMMAWFCASLFYTTHQPLIRATSLWRTISHIALCLLLLGGFFITRYGNENMDYITADELAGVQYLYQVAPPHALLLQGWTDTPWQYQDYERYTYQSLNVAVPEAVRTENIPALVHFFEQQVDKHQPTYLIITRSQQVSAESFDGLPKGLLTQIEARLLKSGKVKLLFSNKDVQVLTTVGK